jgi:plasmid stability protein
MTLIIDLPDELESALLAQAQAQGVSADRFARRVLEQALSSQGAHPGRPFETGRGMLAKYGPAPSAEEIDANRADMFRGFAEDF